MARHRQQSETWFFRSLCTCDEGDPVPQLRSRYTNSSHALTRTRGHAYHCKSCFCPPHCVTGFLLPDTGAGTNARHVSTTRVLLLCRWKERARLRVNMEKTRSQYSSFLRWYAAWSTHAMCTSCRQCRCLRSERKARPCALIP
jgi:hypothetical protein